MAKKLSKEQSFSANFKILGDFLEFSTRNCNYEFFQKGGLLRFDQRWSSLISDALDQTPPPVPMGQTLFYFFGSRAVWCNMETFTDSKTWALGSHLNHAKEWICLFQIPIYNHSPSHCIANLAWCHFLCFTCFFLWKNTRSFILRIFLFWTFREWRREG